MPSGELRGTSNPAPTSLARGPGGPPGAFSIDELLVGLRLTAEPANDGITSEPYAQARTLGALWIIQSVPKLSAAEYARLIARYDPADPRVEALDEVRRTGRGPSFRLLADIAGFCDKKTADRAVQVLVRGIDRPRANGGRDAVLVVAAQGKGGKATTYALNWTAMRLLADGELLPLFDAAAAAGKLDPLGGSLDPLARNGGRGGNFLVAQQQDQQPPPPPSLSGARQGVEVPPQGVEADTQGVKLVEADWPNFDRQVQAAGVNSPKHRREWFAAACERGWTPAELQHALAFHAEHAAAWRSAGVIGQAIKNGPPQGDLWALFPPAAKGYTPDPAVKGERRELRQHSDRETQRSTLISLMRADGRGVAEINARLLAEGFDELATLPLDLRELARQRRQARPRESGDPP